MRSEAAGAGLNASPYGNHARLQILTMAELLAGRRIDASPSQQADVTFKVNPPEG